MGEEIRPSPAPPATATTTKAGTRWESFLEPGEVALSGGGLRPERLQGSTATRVELLAYPQAVGRSAQG